MVQLRVLSGSRRCPGCPADRDHSFVTMIGEGKGECAFHGITMEPRGALPERWFVPGGAAIVRHGAVIRTRSDAHGRVHGVDLAGPGHLLPLEPGEGRDQPGGYAISAARLCLASDGAFERALSSGGEHADDVADLVRVQRDAMRRVERFSEARGRPGVESRVAAVIGVILDELGLDLVLPEALQQRDLAILAGVRHESVCRAIGTLEASGMVARTLEGLRILDREALDGL